MKDSKKNKESIQLKVAKAAFARKYKKPNPGPVYSWPMGVWFSIFFIVPILIIVAYSFCKKDNFGGIQWSFTLDAYKAIFSTVTTINPVTGEAVTKFVYLPLLWRTLWTTVVATFLSIAIALPCGYAMARSKRQTLFLVLIIIPFLTNSLIRIYAWKTILGTEGPLNQFCGFFAKLYFLITQNPDGEFHAIQFIGTNTAIILVNIYMYLPYAILPVFTSVDRFDFTLLEAARDLGATKPVAMFKVLLPGIKSGIVSALIFTFIPIFGNYTVPLLVGSKDTRMLGQTIYEAATTSRNLPLASSFSVILTLVSMIAILYMLTSEKKEASLKKMKSE